MGYPSAGAVSDWPSGRAELYRALMNVPGLELAHWVDPIFLGLPFRLGETAADAAYPFAFDDDFNDLANFAVDDLTDLLRRRREAVENRPSSTPEVEIGGRGLRPPSWSLAPFTEGSPGLFAARRGVFLDAVLDATLFEAWIPRGHGGPLFDRLSLLYTRLFEEDGRAGAGSAPALLALGILGTISHLETKKARAKALVTRQFPLERIDRTVGSALFSLVEAALAQALAAAPASYALQARALLCPLSFYSFRQQPLLFDINPWGLSELFASAADRVWLALLEENPDPRGGERRLAEAFHADPDLYRRAAEAGGVMLMRRRALDWLAIYDGHDADLSAALVSVAVNTEALCTALSEPKALLGRLARFAKSLKPDAAGEAATAALADSLKKGALREDTVPDVATAYSVLALDRVMVECTDRARTRLKDRRAEYTREQLVSDYLAGRLYRLSTDGKPVRRTPVKKTQGHLFIDLKGFTQRTYRAKELVMAEFLRTEFYEPILAAASKRVEGLGGETQLVLQNLLGDAAVFSGEMAALVDLAQDIQRLCRAYAEKLRSRTGTDGRDVDTRRAEVEARLRAELERLRSEATALERGMQSKQAMPVADLERTLFGTLALRVAELEGRRREAAQRGRAPEAQRHQEAVAALKAREKELFSRIENLFGPSRDKLVADLALVEDRNHLKELERRAAEARAWAKGQLRSLDEEVRASRGGGLEAGLFITFGANAEIASMADQQFGQVKVAIAEKINEAARGTARNGIIKSKLDGLLARARVEGNNARLELPFRVYVDSAYNLLLPSELSELIDGAVRDREPNRAREAAKAIAEMVLRDLARAMAMGDGQPAEVLSSLSDIYNTGEALSGEALAALLTQTSASRTWFRRVLQVEELDAEFRDLFVFVQDSLEIIVTLPPDGDVDRAALFRRAGQVQFRGFEAKSPTSVWELLRPDSPFALLLAQKHLPLWTAEARGRLAGELPA
ncbi:MAG TPA: hypothetical protein VGK67_25680 [Myxococcales bacterium]